VSQILLALVGQYSLKACFMNGKKNWNDQYAYDNEISLRMNLEVTLPLAQLQQVFGLFLLLSCIEWLGLHGRNPSLKY
jgi:hypothetical protein